MDHESQSDLLQSILTSNSLDTSLSKIHKDPTQYFIQVLRYFSLVSIYEDTAPIEALKLKVVVILWAAVISSIFLMLIFDLCSTNGTVKRLCNFRNIAPTAIATSTGLRPTESEAVTSFSFPRVFIILDAEDVDVTTADSIAAGIRILANTYHVILLIKMPDVGSLKISLWILLIG